VVERAGEVGFGLEAAGAALLVLGIVLLLLAHLPAALGRGERALADPWSGHTLEWATASPPPYQNFDSALPPLTSPYPLLGVAATAEEVR
jgi:cytochrome c oxidase subunit 1